MTNLQKRKRKRKGAFLSSEGAVAWCVWTKYTSGLTEGLGLQGTPRRGQVLPLGELCVLHLQGERVTALPSCLSRLVAFLCVLWLNGCCCSSSRTSSHLLPLFPSCLLILWSAQSWVSRQLLCVCIYRSHGYFLHAMYVGVLCVMCKYICVVYTNACVMYALFVVFIILYDIYI